MLTTITEAGFNAMVAFACQPGNEEAFSNGKTSMNEHDEEKIFRAVLERLSLGEAMERAKYGHSSKHLISTLYYVKGKSGMAGVHVLKDRLEHDQSEWSAYALSEFSEWYWGMVLKDRIEKSDYRRAWDDIRKAKRELKPFDIKTSKIEWMLKDLYHAMQEAGLVARDWRSGVHHFRHNTPVAGMPFLVEMYPKRQRDMGGFRTQPRMIMAGSYEIEYHEQIILTLAQYFADERKKKKLRKAARKAA